MKWHINPNKLIIHNKLVCKKTQYYEEYFLNGELHNPNGPALIHFMENGMQSGETYFLNNELHNPNGPACTWWNPDGSLCSEAYYIEGKRHRLDGPAIRTWYLGQPHVAHESYYIDDIKHPKLIFDLLTKNSP